MHSLYSRCIAQPSRSKAFTTGSPTPAIFDENITISYFMAMSLRNCSTPGLWRGASRTCGPRTRGPTCRPSPTLTCGGTVWLVANLNSPGASPAGVFPTRIDEGRGHLADVGREPFAHRRRLRASRELRLVRVRHERIDADAQKGRRAADGDPELRRGARVLRCWVGFFSRAALRAARSSFFAGDKPSRIASPQGCGGCSREHRGDGRAAVTQVRWRRGCSATVGSLTER